MNVVFHTLTGLAVASVISSCKQFGDSTRLFIPSDALFLSAGFAVGLISHGFLDVAPHTYPIKSAADVSVGLLLIVSALIFARRRCRALLAVCFVGSIFPDLVDLGPAILNKRLGWSLPVVKIFPWHWHEYSGSVYDGSRPIKSLVSHLVVVTIGLGVLYVFRKTLFPLRQGAGRHGQKMGHP